MSAEDLADAINFSFAVHSAQKLDRHLIGELAGRLVDAD
jgi:hypothetical protein